MSRWRFLTAPVIYSLILPIALIDVWGSLYQRVCFPFYGLTLVGRREYLVLDRHRLPYLSLVEKAHCLFCSYVNGVIARSREIAGRTELYWCPIRHNRQPNGAHRHVETFISYGDVAGYRARMAERDLNR